MERPEHLSNAPLKVSITVSDYWASTRSPVHMFRPAYRTAELDAYIVETAGIDPAMLAEESGINRAVIRAYQRQLGVRKITGNVRKGSR